MDIFLLARNYPAGTSELFPLGANSDLRRNFTLSINFPAGVKSQIYVEIIHYVKIVLQAPRNLSLFWSHLGSYLGVKIPGDSFSGIPLRFRWCLGINSFWSQIGSLLEFSRGTSE